MNSINSNLARDLGFGAVQVVLPVAPSEDINQGIDAWLVGHGVSIPFACRTRRISLKQYGEISVRFSRVSGSKTEYAKLLDGDVKAQVYVSAFTDGIVICLVKDIVQCVQDGRYLYKRNRDGKTSAIYIKITDIPHLLLEKVRQNV